MKIRIGKSDLKSLETWSFQDTGVSRTRSGGIRGNSGVIHSIVMNSDGSNRSVGISNASNTNNSTPMDGSRFEGNNDGGGGTYTADSTPMDGGRFEGNNDGGGGTYTADSTPMDGSRYEDNDDGGGGTYTTDSFPMNSGCHEGNNDGGGGTYTADSTLMDGGRFEGNNDGGGGTYTADSTPMDGSRYEDNDDGGEGTFTADSTPIDGGRSEGIDDGGGSTYTADYTPIDGSRYEGNDDGGGVTFTADGTLMDGSRCEGNDNGGVGNIDEESSVDEYNEDENVTRQNIDDMTLYPDNVDAVIEGEKEFSCLDNNNIDDEDDIDNDDLEYVYTPTFTQHDDMSMKIISFPQLKNLIECSLTCQKCILLKRKSNLMVSQKTFKLATVIYVKCSKGHKFYITPERVDNSKTHSSTNFKINYFFIVAMQLLGKGLYSMSTLFGMLGIRVSHGNYKIWKKIQNTIGEKQQILAKQCCVSNLQNEVEATKASGILPGPDGQVGIVCSGDTGWQGNSSRCTYNSQSGQTTLCGGLTKKVVAFKKNPSCVEHVLILKNVSGMFLMKTKSFSHD